MIKNLSGEYETVEYDEKKYVMLYDNTDNESYPVHWHNAVELIMPMKNEYIVNVGGVDHHIPENDILVIPPCELHSMPAVKGRRLIFQCDNAILGGVPALEAAMRAVSSPLIINSAYDTELHILAQRTILDIVPLYSSRAELSDVKIYLRLIELFTAMREHQLERQKGMMDCADDKLDEYSEKFSEMEDLKSEYGELAFTVNVEGGEGADRLSEIKTEYNKLKADADKIKDEYLAPSVEKAKEAYAKLQSGEEFSKVAEEYSPDTEGNENGLLISVKHSGSYDWSKEVKDAFAKIKQGEYTEPVKDDEGVHILYYLSDEPAGEVGLDSVKDKIKEILMIDVQEDEWNQMLETWKNDESVHLNEELVRSVTYSPVSVG